MTDVSWFAAWSFAKWTGKRLATAEEWDRAARGTDGRRLPARFPDRGGKQNIYNCRPSHDTHDCYRETAPVDSMPDGGTPDGCLHMSGNVWEWISDQGECRGGSWNDDPSRLSLDCRDGRTRPGPWHRSAEHGFRCVRDP